MWCLNTMSRDKIREVTEPLMDMNQELTTENENLNEVILQGAIGYHIFTDTEPDSPVDCLSKEIHHLLDEVLQETFIQGLEEEDLRERYGDVSPETVAGHVTEELSGDRGPFKPQAAEYMGDRLQEILEERSE